MAEPTECQCVAVFVETHDGEQSANCIRCDRCKKRDELWDDLVSELKFVLYHGADDTTTIKRLLDRAKEVS